MINIHDSSDAAYHPKNAAAAIATTTASAIGQPANAADRPAMPNAVSAEATILMRLFNPTSRSARSSENPLTKAAANTHLTD